MSLGKAIAGAQENKVPKIGTMDYGKQLMNQLMPAIQKSIPKHLSGDRMSRIVLTEFYKNPDLLSCTKESLIGGILQSSQLGLEIGSGMGQAYLLPFNNRKNGTKEAQFVIGYQGMIELARRSGMIKDIFASVVHEGDHFECKRSLEKDILEHEELYESDVITHVYAICRFTNGGYAYECWPIKKVKAHMNKHSKSKGQYGPWKDDFEGMARKTLIRSLFKYLPKSPELAQAIELDEKKITGDLKDPENLNIDIVEGEVVDVETGEIQDEAQSENKDS